jgi:hypothetical protein
VLEAKDHVGVHVFQVFIALDDNKPLITKDMTLVVEGSTRDYQMPIIRYPNYTDLTWDVAMEKIPIVVGNEVNGPLHTINLKEYLQVLHSFRNPSLDLRSRTLLVTSMIKERIFRSIAPKEILM